MGKQIKVNFLDLHESMWVEVEEGDENDGVGSLLNDSCMDPQLRCGSKIHYETYDLAKKPRATIVEPLAEFIGLPNQYFYDNGKSRLLYDENGNKRTKPC